MGLGNPILSDDSVGIKVAQMLKKADPPLKAEIKEACAGGLTILDELDGFDRVILVDSIKTGKASPGTIYRLKEEDFNSTTQLSDSHGIDFFTAIEMGRIYGCKMPELIDIFAVEVEDNVTFSEDCTDKVMESIPILVRQITEEVSR